MTNFFLNTMTADQIPHRLASYQTNQFHDFDTHKDH